MVPAVTAPTAPAIDVRKSDRVVIVGATGTGKSTVAGCLLLPRRHIVILDPKRQWTWPNRRSSPYGATVTTTIPEDVVKHEGPHPLVYQPETTEIKAGLPWFWDWLWWRENTLIYCDELFLLKKNSQELHPGQERIIMQGRSRNLSNWNAFQRPSRVPIPPLSESEHVFVFRLRHPDDIKRMAQYTDKRIETDPVSGHDFWYYGDRDQTLIKTNAKRMSIRER